jgi:hypothetical protein
MQERFHTFLSFKRTAEQHTIASDLETQSFVVDLGHWNAWDSTVT